FVRAMYDDFGVPEALAVIHERVRAGNVALDRQDALAALEAAKDVRAMLDVLGVNPERAPWMNVARGTSVRTQEVLAALVEGLLDERRAAREAKDFERSDEIRDRLVAAGVSIEDHAGGTRWSVK